MNPADFNQANSIMSCFVYILRSEGSDGYCICVGWKIDLERRLAQLNAGTGARSTSGRKWRLLYVPRCFNRNEAMNRVWYVKKDREFRTAFVRRSRGHRIAG